MVICIVAILREIAVYGTVWGKALDIVARFPEAAYPYAAIILLGLMAAFLQQMRLKYAHILEDEEEIIRE